MSYKEIQIPSPYKYVSQYFKEDLPDNAYINKTLCGCGATTFVLTNNIDYIVAIPFQSLGDNKVIQSIDNPEYPYELFVYHSSIERVGEKLREYLDRVEAKGHPIKLLVTYDSLPKLQTYMDFSSLKLFIDEGHKVLEYVGNFKPKVIKDMLALIPKFKSFVTVTATPTREEYIPVEFQQYEKIKLCWSDTTEVKFNHCKIYPNQLKEVLLSLCLDYLRGDKEGNAYIFINSVERITTLIKELTKIYGYSSNDIKVVCAKSERNQKSLRKLGKDFLPKAVIEPNDDRFYKINFITSTSFEGSDFLDPDGNTIIISDSSLEHTKLDISTQVSQIVGRLRISKYKHIVNMYWTSSPTNGFNTEEEYKEYVLEQEQDYLKAIQDFNNAASPVTKTALIQVAKTSPYLIEDEEECSLEINPNAVNHLMNNFIGTSLQYFVNTESDISLEDKVSFTLREVFSGEISNTIDIPKLSVKDKKKLGRKTNFGKTVRYFLELRERFKYAISKEQKENLKLAGEEILTDYPILKNYIEVFGVSPLLELDEASIRESRLDDELTSYYRRQHLITVLPKYFIVGESYTKEELKTRIQSICDKHKIDIKAKASDINLAFESKSTTTKIEGKTVNCLKLISLL